MASWTSLGWMILVVLALGAGFFIGAFVLHWYGRRQLLGSLKYILDRLKVVEAEMRHMGENEIVLLEFLKSRGLVDEEDLAELHRELIERPRQLEAERAELLMRAQDEDMAERLVKNVPDTLH